MIEFSGTDGYTCYFVNSFTDRADGGNPAAVCVTDKWPDDSVMLGIAAHNGLSETAFCVKDSAEQPQYHIRWFTPACEVPLCGHATLAAAAVLFRFFHPGAERILFHSKSGMLGVTKKSALYELDFPAHNHRIIYRDGRYLGKSGADMALVEKTLKALSAQSNPEYLPLEIFRSCDAVAVLRTEAAVRRFEPRYDEISDISAGENSDIEGLIITSVADSPAQEQRGDPGHDSGHEGYKSGCVSGHEGHNSGQESGYNLEYDLERDPEYDSGYDFVSRCFYPTEGIPEDPVTGSAHSTLVPYWALKSGRKELKAYQASARGGELFCMYRGDRVLISGKAFILNTKF